MTVIVAAATDDEVMMAAAAAAAAVTVEVVNVEKVVDGKTENEDVATTFDAGVMIADDVFISLSCSLSVSEGLAPPFVTDAVGICDEEVERLLVVDEVADDVAVGVGEDVIDIVTLSV